MSDTPQVLGVRWRARTEANGPRILNKIVIRITDGLACEERKKITEIQNRRARYALSVNVQLAVWSATLLFPGGRKRAGGKRIADNADATGE